MIAVLLAHGNGADEIAFVLTPVALFAGLLAVANRRARDAMPQDELSAGDDRDAPETPVGDADAPPPPTE